MTIKRTSFRSRAAGRCCVAILAVLCSSCAQKTKTSSSKTSEPTAKSAVLYKDAKKKNVIAAEFMKTPLSTKQIAALGKHTKLEEITFYECSRFSDEVCNELAKLERVTTIHLVRCTIDDSTLAGLSKMENVVQLTLSNASVTSKGIAALKTWKNLKRLTLTGTIKTGAIDGLAELLQLESLEIGLIGFSLRQLAGKPLPNMRNLKVLTQGTGDDDLSVLPAWKTLERLDLRGEKLTDVGVVHLERFSSLKNLTISSAKITDAGLSELSQRTKLESLNLYGCITITNSGMKTVATMPVLKRLMLEHSGVTGPGLMNLVPSKSLRYVLIGADKASAADVAKADAAMPNCQFERMKYGP
ncbi:MAG: hypothetical protein IID46_04175 [Planctomycetes bacterium]|nr:hypothetical protein [Planctomycetota bacterium]